MWKSPFLNTPTFGLCGRVPSGDMTIETPFRSLSTAGCNAETAFDVLLRSTKATSPSEKSCPITGTCFTSALATTVKPRCTTRVVTSMSIIVL